MQQQQQCWLCCGEAIFALSVLPHGKKRRKCGFKVQGCPEVKTFRAGNPDSASHGEDKEEERTHEVIYAINENVWIVSCPQKMKSSPQMRVRLHQRCFFCRESVNVPNAHQESM